MTNIVYVRTPEGKAVLCKVIQIIASSYTLMQQVQVQALHGRPFGGNRIAVVSINRTFPANVARASKANGELHNGWTG